MTTKTNVRDVEITEFDSSSKKLNSEGKSDNETVFGGVTRRAVVLSLLLAATFGCVIPYSDYLLRNTRLGGMHLPLGAVAALLLLLGMQTFLRWVGPLATRWRLTTNEILTVYITCLFSVLMPGRSGDNFFLPNLLAPFYYATRENKWLEFLQPSIKPWFTPALTSSGSYNQRVVEDWFVGTGTGIPWDAWLVPLLAWSLLIGALYIMLACLGVMLRAQWVEREALTFPLLLLPVEMTAGAEHEDEGFLSFFRNPVMWIGFGIAVVIQGMNGLNSYFPDVPAIPLTLDTGPLLSEAPWNQVGPLGLRVMPIVVGLSFLISSEVSLSLWFFYLLHKLEMLGAYAFGFMPSSLPEPVWTRGYAKAFISYQTIGAYFAFSAILLWTGREHYGYIVRRALGRTKAKSSERREALSYPLAFWGFIGSSAFLVAWSVAAGVRVDIALVLWAIYLVSALGLSRVVAESGLLCINHGWSPLGPLAHLVGAGPGTWLGASSVVPASIIQSSFMVDMKGLLLPSFLHAFKLAHDRKIPQRPLLTLIFASITIAFGLGIYMNLHLGYEQGALQMHEWFARKGPQEPPRTAHELLGGVQDNFSLNWMWFALGALMLSSIVAARSYFSWFPLHPIGLLMWSPYVMYAMWLSIFLGWLAKTLIMRFGGPTTYRRAVPGFLGLVLGDITMMLLMAAIDAWQGRIGHDLLPL
ncbi:hypothetical protein IAD21_00143 [Abditibacteriota bacterium]|nr:hypothetical protein IAD21_00143 [Abditibacteriota bacterium]